jgi:hypothetical protein
MEGHVMVIRHSNQLLEQLSEVEERIQQLERLMEELNIECDQEKLIRTLLSKKFNALPGQQKRNLN